MLHDGGGGGRGDRAAYLRVFVAGVQLAAEILAGTLKLDLLHISLECQARIIKIPSLLTKPAKARHGKGAHRVLAAVDLDKGKLNKRGA